MEFLQEWASEKHLARDPEDLQCVFVFVEKATNLCIEYPIFESGFMLLPQMKENIRSHTIMVVDPPPTCAPFLRLPESLSAGFLALNAHLADSRQQQERKTISTATASHADGVR